MGGANYSPLIKSRATVQINFTFFQTGYIYGFQVLGSMVWQTGSHRQTWLFILKSFFIEFSI